MALTQAQADLAISIGLETGVDSDTQTPQLLHLAYPYQINFGTICKSEHLWFQSKQIDPEEISCNKCELVIREWAGNHGIHPDIQRYLGRMAEVSGACRDLIHESLDVIDILSNATTYETEEENEDIMYGSPYIQVLFNHFNDGIAALRKLNYGI